MESLKLCIRRMNKLDKKLKGAGIIIDCVKNSIIMTHRSDIYLGNIERRICDNIMIFYYNKILAMYKKFIYFNHSDLYFGNLDEDVENMYNKICELFYMMETIITDEHLFGIIKYLENKQLISNTHSPRFKLDYNAFHDMMYNILCSDFPIKYKFYKNRNVNEDVNENEVSKFSDHEFKIPNHKPNYEFESISIPKTESELSKISRQVIRMNNKSDSISGMLFDLAAPLIITVPVIMTCGFVIRLGFNLLKKYN